MSDANIMSSTIANVFRRWDTLILWSTPEKFWIEATKSKAHLLQINRNDNESKCVISLEPHLGQIPASATKKTIHGIIGLVELPLCQFLLVITRKVQVGLYHYSGKKSIVYFSLNLHSPIYDLFYF